MAYDPVPRCPRCSSTKLTLVAQQHRYRDPSRKQPVSTFSIYDCACGTGFTHQLKHDVPETPAKTA